MSFLLSQINLTRQILRAQCHSSLHLPTKPPRIHGTKIFPRNFSSNPSIKNSQNTVTDLDIPSEVIANSARSIEIVLQSIIGVNHSILEGISSLGGFSWFATIIVTTIALRSCTTLPIAIYQQKKIGRLNALKPVLEAWGNTYKRQFGSKPIVDSTSILFLQRGIETRYKSKVQQLYKDYGYSPLALYALPFVQLPLFFSMSFTIRSMSGSPLFGWESFTKFNEPGMSTGGISWLYDLTLQDPTMILPFCLVAVHLLNIELSTLLSMSQVSRSQKILSNIGRGLGIVMFPVAAVSPMALSVFWITSASFSLLQNILLRLSFVRRALKLPAIPVSNAKV